MRHVGHGTSAITTAYRADLFHVQPMLSKVKSTISKLPDLCGADNIETTRAVDIPVDGITYRREQDIDLRWRQYNFS